MISGSLFNLRNRLLASGRFRRIAQKLPITQVVANRRATELFRIASGFVHSQVLLTCVRLDLFDRLSDGPISIDALASEGALPVERAWHLVRAAAALDLFQICPGDKVGLGRLGATMVGNESLTALVEHHSLVYDDLRDPVRLFTGDGPETKMAALWPYAGAHQPDALATDDVASYTALMAASQSMVAEQVIDAFSFRGVGSLLDVGGGAGAFAMAVARRWRRLAVTVADLPAVAEVARQAIDNAGLADRVAVVGTDATTGELPAGFDVVSLVRILHDHDDARALKILGAARSALAPGGTLLIAEPIAAPDPAGELIDAYFNVYLLAMGSGKPRTVEALSTLLREAGFGPVRRHRTPVSLVTSVLSTPVLG